MASQVELGLLGLSVPIGTHIYCSFRRVEEHNEVVMRCFVVIATASKHTVSHSNYSSTAA
jgi:hypothetical protein